MVALAGIAALVIPTRRSAQAAEATASAPETDGASEPAVKAVLETAGH